LPFEELKVEKIKDQSQLNSQPASAPLRVKKVEDHQAPLLFEEIFFKHHSTS